MKKILIYILFFFILSCNSNKTLLKTGMWRAKLQLPTGELPFNFEVKKDSIDNIYLEIINSTERIRVDEIEFKNDSIFIKLPIFDTKIIVKNKGENLNGEWFDYSRKGEYKIPFNAKFGIKNRFVAPDNATAKKISEKWEVTFWSDTSKAIGLFYQDSVNRNKLTGTFLTETGDYRYLEGVILDDSIKLSCFDGSHAFLFQAKINSDSTLQGNFSSGIHHRENWTAIKNNNASLRNADSLTFLKSGYDKIFFSFPNLDSQFISIDDVKFKNKIVIVQIMGTWCPNCMDETNFLSNFYKKNKDKGVEIIGLSYERITDFSRVKNNLERLIRRFDVQYEILFAGTNKLEEAVKTLPMLNKIMSFPTTIIIDKRGIVRKIHTGYSGPATGKEYEKFVIDFNNFILKLTQE